MPLLSLSAAVFPRNILHATPPASLHVGPHPAFLLRAPSLLQISQFAFPAKEPVTSPFPS